MNGQNAELTTVVSAHHEDVWTTAGIWRLCVLAMTAGVVVAALGPFGTFNYMSVVERFTFWEVVLVAAATIHIPSLWLADRFGKVFALPTICWVLGSAFVAAIPTTFVVTGVVAIFYGMPRPPDFATMFGYVVTVSMPMQVLSFAVLRVSMRLTGPVTGLSRTSDGDAIVRTPDGPTAAAKPYLAAIWKRLPVSIGTDLVCLQMQDHYVRVYTAQGSALLLMRMSDAEREIGDVEGARVHRSWWIARNAVQSVGRNGRSTKVVLTNGLTVPVSRDRDEGLRQQLTRWACRSEIGAQEP